MNTIKPLLIVACAVLLYGCGSTIPKELVNARQAYLEASEGPAAQLSPAKLHEAKQALTQAEQAFEKNADSYRTRDLAYVAQRKAEMAQTQAMISQERGVATAANKDFEVTQGSILRETTRDLQDAQSALVASELSGQATADRLDAEQKAHLETGKLMAAQEQQRQQTQPSPPDQQAPVLPPVAVAPAPAPSPPPAPAPAPAPITPPASAPVAEASVEQRVATEVARLESMRKAAEQGQQLERSTQDLNETRTALAVSEHAGRSAAEQLALERRARLDTESRSTAQDLQMEEQTRELARSKAERAASAQTTAQDLDQSQSALAASEQASQATSELLAVEQKARKAAEAKTAETQAELDQLIAVRDDKRAEAFTLSGSVLFRSNEANLMAGAEPRLDQLVAMLAANPDRTVVITGHTDSQGSAQHNLDLSQRRADAVRDYLVRHGHPADRVTAIGQGEGSPTADNTTSEGRANNRRVEIVLERGSTP